jgi:uncharacterized protein (DUF1800 family)
MQTLKRTALSLSAAALCCLTALSSVSAGTFTATTKADSELLEYKVYAAQFLNMATFGASASDIDALAARMSVSGVDGAREDWIDDQFDIPASEHYALAKQMIGEYGYSETTGKSSTVRYQAWWHHAVGAPDQLRQRVAWALAQIWVTDGKSAANFLGGTSYYDVLVRNSFENYRDLMEDMTLNPVMGDYLSYYRNRKADPARNRYPDENYARELLQLFTIGPLKLELNGDFKTESGNRIPTYGNTEITAFARAFTGLDSATSTRFGQGSRNWHLPMKMWDSAHDMDAKELLEGKWLSANQTGMQDLRGALDNVFQHPNLGPFVARLLIQRLVMSNPSKDYVKRVAIVLNGDGGAPRGDMKAVIKAILLDSEATSGVSITPLTESSFVAESGDTQVSRLKEPVVRYAGLIRAFNPTSTCPKGRFILRPQTQLIGQGPYESPSVFNFYSPDFQPAGPLAAYPDDKLRDNIAVAPEFQIWTPIALSRFSNQLMTTIRQEKVATKTLSGTSCAIALDLRTEKQLAAKPADLVNHLDLLLCQGTMSDKSRDTIVKHITSETTNAAVRAQNAILATMLTPECAISP